ncbi:MAG: hypothetical protein HC896_00185 [Bacteroidales bacterium]|nr:hypothetical protein [Bacteroidales bacterium]
MLFALSLIYYPIDVYWQNGQYGRLLASVLYSGMFTISIYYFSRMAADRQEADAELHQYRSKYFDTEMKLHETTSTLNQTNKLLQETTSKQDELEKTLHQRTNELHEAKTELLQLKKMELEVAAACTCKKCGRTFLSEASRRSHEGRCNGVAMEKKAA